MGIYIVYGIDVTIDAVLVKGNFDQMKVEVENLSTISRVCVSTNDSKSYSYLFKGEVSHLPSKLFSLPDNTMSKLFESSFFFIVGFFSIARRLKEVEVIISQGTTALQGPVAHFLFKKPHVLFLHYFAYNEQLLLKKNLLASLFRIVELFSIRHSNIVIVPTEKLRSEAFAHGAKLVQIIPNFVETKKIEQMGGKDIFRKKFRFGKDKKVILFVGRLHRVKNIDLLLKSFSRLDKMNNCILLIIGDGPERQRLIDLASNLGIRDKVRFEGFKPKETVLEFMKASDVLVLPSLVEGQPRVVLEAWACGLPVVASKVPGLENLINDGIDGLLFDLHSEEKLAEAISIVLDSKVASTLRFNAKMHVVQYSAENVFPRQQKIIMKFLLKRVPIN